MCSEDDLDVKLMTFSFKFFGNMSVIWYSNTENWEERRQNRKTVMHPMKLSTNILGRLYIIRFSYLKNTLLISVANYSIDVFFHMAL